MKGVRLVLVSLLAGCTMPNPGFSPGTGEAGTGGGTGTSDTQGTTGGTTDPSASASLSGSGETSGSSTGSTGSTGGTTTGVGTTDGPCPTPATECSGQCVNLQNDPDHCGACDTPCADTCLGGGCVVTRTIFVTSVMVSGNLGGLEGADTLCQERATEAALPGSYMAWLSAGDANPLSRMKQHPGPYLLPNGKPVAMSWTDLTDGSLLHPVDVDELGNVGGAQLICEGGEVFTNTKPDGTTASDTDCGGWTIGDAASGTVVGNSTLADTAWTLMESCPNVSCGAELPIYCVEQ